MQDLIATLTSSDVGAWVAAAGVVVTAANAITALTPTEYDNKALAIASKILNWLSLNVYKNKNADSN